jgi:hypothetical protein
MRGRKEFDIARSDSDEAIHTCFAEAWIASLALAMTGEFSTSVIPGRCDSIEPGIHTPDRGYGFRACAKRRIPE